MTVLHKIAEFYCHMISVVSSAELFISSQIYHSWHINVPVTGVIFMIKGYIVRICYTIYSKTWL
jgi:hypothetical protein